MKSRYKIILKEQFRGYKNNILKFTKYIEAECGISELEEVSYIHIKKYLNYLQGKESCNTNISR